MSAVTHPRFIVFLTLLIGLAAVLWRPLGGARAVSAAFDIAVIVYVIWVGRLMRSSDADDIRRHAARNDEGRGALLAIAALVTGVILVTVGLELHPSAHKSAVDIAFPLVTLVLAWVFGNTVYALHYAHLYYDQTPDGKDSKGLNFPGEEDAEPGYWDFCYLAFNNGMAFQVSDVQTTSQSMRIVMIIHCVIAFFYNIGIVALSINIVAGAASAG